MPLPRPIGRCPRPLLVVLLLLTSAIGVRDAAAQQTRTGTIIGRVVDDRGLAVPLAAAAAAPDSGAETTAAGWSAARGTTADEAGLFRLVGLSPGRYRLRVQRVGYRAVIVTGTVVRAQQTTEVRVVMQTTAAELAPVVVAAPTVTIRREDTELGTVIGAESIELLPVGLDTRAIVAFTPGARQEAVWGGASAQANSYQLDGLAANHPGVGGRLIDANVSWVEALEVKGLGSGAELGDFQGGVINVVTKSGTNDFRGTVRANYETHRLNGSNVGLFEAVPELAGRREVDGEVGGPLLRDRLFYYLSGQLIQRDTRVRDQLGGFAPEGLAFAQGYEERQDVKLFGKLSFQSNANGLAHLTVLHAGASAENAGRTGFETLAATRRLRNPTTLAMLDWQQRTRVGELSLKLSRSQLDEELTPYGGRDVAGVSTFRTVDPVNYVNAAFDEERRARTNSAIASWRTDFSTLGLSHTLRVGGELTDGTWYDRRSRTGGLTWRPATAFRPITRPFIADVPASWAMNNIIPITTGGEVLLDAAVRNVGLYVQDNISIGSRVSIAPGVRWGSWAGQLRPADGGPRFDAVDDQAFDPRIGLIIDPSAEGDFVVKAHWGRYHQGMFAQLFDRIEGSGVFTNEQTWYYTGPAPATPGATFTEAELLALQQQGRLTLQEQQVLNETGPALNYKQPYVDQLVLSMEKTFGPRWKMEMRYVGRQNKRMVALMDRNAATNYTEFNDIRVRHAGSVLSGTGGLPVRDAHGNALELESLYIPNWAIEEFLRRKAAGLYPTINLHGFVPADTANISWDPDYVLTNVPGAKRLFDQYQFVMTARYPQFMVSGSVVYTRLEGNLGTVTGYTDARGRGAGPWVRPNEMVNFFGPLGDASELEAKLLTTGQLPWGFRGGAFWTFRTGDRSTPTFLLSGQHFDYVPVVRGPITEFEAEQLPQLVTNPLVGQAMYVEPRGRYRMPARWLLDLHLERAFPVRGAEVVLAADVFNLFGETAVTRSNTRLDAIGVQTATSVFGAPLAREAPRTLRVGTAVSF